MNLRAIQMIARLHALIQFINKFFSFHIVQQVCANCPVDHRPAARMKECCVIVTTNRHLERV